MNQYDLCLAWYWEYDIEFVRMVESACASRGITLCQVTPETLLQTIRSLQSQEFQPSVFFDRANDDLRFEPIRKWAANNGIYYINPPEVSFKAEQKDDFHHMLMANGISVPKTIVLPSFLDHPLLDPVDLTSLGVQFVAKPAYAGGGTGVALDLYNWEQVLQARIQVPNQRYLLQSHVDTQMFNGRQTWFRVYYCGGKIYPCWWETDTHAASPVTAYEEARFGLSKLRDITHQIAKLSGLDIFSTEIALTPEGEFVAVDYINDSIDLRAQSKAMDGVPDIVLWYIAYALAGLVEQKKITKLTDSSFKNFK
jgi:glutathione synthase/RimK-type ligase-like ATP-grasp enzyme